MRDQIVLLLAIDRDLAAAARHGGCLRCGGRLDGADYGRKPRGALGPLPDGYDRRLSFCCAREGCRRRRTPPSVRFLGRKVYLGAVVLLVSALRHDRGFASLASLRQLLGVDAKTVRRWRGFWLEIFAQSPFWRLARGRLSPSSGDHLLPASLLDAFLGDALARLLAALRLLAPITSRPGLGAQPA